MLEATSAMLTNAAAAPALSCDAGVHARTAACFAGRRRLCGLVRRPVLVARSCLAVAAAVPCCRRPHPALAASSVTARWTAARATARSAMSRSVDVLTTLWSPQLLELPMNVFASSRRRSEQQQQRQRLRIEKKTAPSRLEFVAVGGVNGAVLRGVWSAALATAARLLADAGGWRSAQFPT
uniref:Uncharacterized protein n=1 Tax=Macrostomum lignano TaxID=282301 RepID=A0A1I8FQQ4_9PLAT